MRCAEWALDQWDIRRRFIFNHVSVSYLTMRGPQKLSETNEELPLLVLQNLQEI